MEEGKIIKSNKGVNDKVYYRGYEYIKDGQNKTKTKLYYACLHYKSMKCSGRLIRDMNQEEGTQLKVTKEHTHVGDSTIIGKVERMQMLKRKAAETTDIGRNVIAKVNENVSVAIAATLPKAKSMAQTVRRARKDNELPPLPKTLNDLVIPDNMKHIGDILFLLYDSGPGPNRILIFSTQRNLEYLKRADVVAMDGTFDIVPPLFSQLYTLQGRVDGWYIPLVYILAPNKFKKMYEEAFKVVKEHAPDCKPAYIVTDFEIGAINAARKHFPNSIIHTCFFHLCQSIWRRLQNLGLQTRYVNDPDFALNVRQLLALAFIPDEDVPACFAKLVKTEFWSENEDPDSEKLRELLFYFESTYIGVETRNKLKRRAVLFPPVMWSVHEITILGIPRTNNILEAWHGVLNRTIGASHPNIFKFITALHTEQKYQELKMAKIDSGHPAENVPRKYRLINERIVATCKKYDNSATFDCINYLNTLAFNIYF